MRFKTRVFFVIFFVSLIPALAVLLGSNYLMNSTLEYVGASGLETSLHNAKTIIDNLEDVSSELLANQLDIIIRYDSLDLSANLALVSNLDIIYRINNLDTTYSISGPDPAKTNFRFENIPVEPGHSFWQSNDRTYLICAYVDSAGVIGCGLLLPENFDVIGRQFSESVAASASLKLYREFLIKLLGVAVIIVVIFAILAGFILSTTISRRLVKPLEALAEGARRVGAGDMDHTVSITGKDEFALLGDSFNKMTTEIKESQAKLIEAEKIAAWREVARRIAHEIKNPLTPITVELYRLKQSIKGDAKLDEQIDLIESRIKALGDLAGHFSVFAKEPELKKVDSSVSEIVAKCVKLYSGYDDVSINRKAVKGLPTLKLDPDMMSRAITNLIKNSIEASTKGAEIDIKTFKDDKTVKIIIKDNGPGYPQEKLDNIDQPYYTTKSSGTGLGLAIVKKIIEEHGGDIRFFNDNGAVAVISLPI